MVAAIVQPAVRCSKRKRAQVSYYEPMEAEEEDGDAQLNEEEEDEGDADDDYHLSTKVRQREKKGHKSHDYKNIDN
jgi:hypothetical protein